MANTAGEQTDAHREGFVLVLLAEDEKVNAEIACAMTGDHGCNAVRATNGYQGLRPFSREHHDLVWDGPQDAGDGRLPSRGADASNRKRVALCLGLRRMPIIGLTANADSGDCEQCIAAGVDDHLGKAYRRGDLQTLGIVG